MKIKNGSMKRFLLSVFGCILTLQLFASDFLPSELYFTNGNIIKGYAKVPSRLSDKFIHFKYKLDSTEIKYPSDELKSITYHTDNGSETYDRLKRYDFPSRNVITGPEWLKVLERGFVTLYYTTSIKGTVSYKIWLCYREGDEAAKLILYITSGVVITLNPNSLFKEKAQEYFSDFPGIEASLKSKKYHWENIDLLVKDYNGWKNEK